MDAEGRQAVAAFRFQVIAPLVTETLGRGEYGRLLARLAQQTYEIPGSDRTRIQRRTLQRWVQCYRQGGLEALQPAVRADHDRPMVITPELLDAAVALRQESPGRSVEQVIAILEMSGKAAPGTLKRSTLSQHLVRAGCTRQSSAAATSRVIIAHLTPTLQLLAPCDSSADRSAGTTPGAPSGSITTPSHRHHHAAGLLLRQGHRSE